MLVEVYGCSLLDGAFDSPPSPPTKLPEPQMMSLGLDVFQSLCNLEKISMDDLSRYRINVEPLVAGLQRVDIASLVAENEPWFNQTLCEVNGCVVRLGILEGDFHWHRHEHEDEFFFVFVGHLLIDVEGEQTIDLGVGQGTLIPKTVVHRPRAPEKSVILMFEGAGVVPTGD